MNKKKHQTRESIFTYLWNEFLFRKRFIFETSLTLETTTEALRELRTPESYEWGQPRVKIWVYPSRDYEFEATLEDFRKEDQKYYLKATANGRLVQNTEANTKIIGYAKIGKELQIALLVFLVMIYFTYNSPIIVIPIVIVVRLGIRLIFAGSFMFYRSVSYRNQLIETIRDTVLKDKAKRHA